MSPESDSGKRHNPGFKYTSAEAAQKMIDNVSAAPDAWNDGIQRSAIDIIAAASTDDAEANFKAAMLKVLNAKLRQAGLRELTTAELKRICSEKSGNWSSGVSAKESKVKSKVAAAIEATYDVADEVRKMKKGLPGSADRKARMTAYFDKRVAKKKATGT